MPSSRFRRSVHGQHPLKQVQCRITSGGDAKQTTDAMTSSPSRSHSILLWPTPLAHCWLENLELFNKTLVQSRTRLHLHAPTDRPTSSAKEKSRWWCATLNFTYNLACLELIPGPNENSFEPTLRYIRVNTNPILMQR